MPTAYPDINGHTYQWSSVETTLGKNLTRALKSITYGDSLTVGKIRGANVKVQGRTRGVQEPRCNAVFYKRQFDELVDELGDGFGEKVFDIVLSYADTGQPTRTDTVVGVRITDYEVAGEEGEDAIEVEAELDPMDVLLQGKSIASKPKTA
jgi:hypothetical protein